MASRNGAAAEVPLDVLGVDGKARIVSQMLAGVQAKRYELLLIQQGGDHKDDDPVPGLGEVTFTERREQLTKGEADLLASVEPKVMDRVRELATGTA